MPTRLFPGLCLAAVVGCNGRLPDPVIPVGSGQAVESPPPCGPGEVDACLAFADRAWEDGDEEGAFDAWSGACGTGDVRGCCGRLWVDPRAPTPGGDAEAVCAAACEGGGEASCLRLADRLRTRHRPRRAREVLLPLCGAAADIGCPDLLWTRVEGEEFEEDRVRFREACEAGGLRGCHALGCLLEQTSNGDDDLEAAVEVLDRACRGGVRGACFRLESALDDLTRDPEWRAEHGGAEVFEAGCGAGEFWSCNLLARAREEAGMVEEALRACRRACEIDIDSCGRCADAPAFAGEDRFEAETVAFVRACEAGDAASCERRGILLEAAGRYDEARTVFRNLCENGRYAGCRRIVESACDAPPEEIERDARVLFPRYCGGGRRRACERLVRRLEDSGGYYEGESLQRCADLLEPLVALLEADCAGGSIESCYQVGRHLAEWRADPDAAEPLLRTACEAGLPEACGVLAFELEGAANDFPESAGAENALREEAAAFHRRACEHGYQPSCDPDSSDGTRDDGGYDDHGGYGGDDYGGYGGDDYGGYEGDDYGGCEGDD
jgi:TPR repeat protein